MTTAAVDAREHTRTEAGLIAGMMAILAWGVGPLFVKSMGVSTATTVAWRFIFAVPVLHVVARLAGGRVDRRMLRAALLPGLLFGASLFVGFASFKHTSVANATLINNLMPVGVVLLARFVFHEHVRARQFAAVGVAVVGMLIVVFAAGSSGEAGLFGDFLALVNTVLWTWFFLQVKNLRDDGAHAWALLAGITTVAAVFAVPPALIVSDDLGGLSASGWCYLAGLVLLPGVLGHGLMTWASGHLPVTVSSLLTLGSPVVSAVGAWIWLGESMNAWQCLGAAIVLAALGAIALNARAPVLAEAVHAEPLE